MEARPTLKNIERKSRVWEVVRSAGGVGGSVIFKRDRGAIEWRGGGWDT